MWMRSTRKCSVAGLRRRRKGERGQTAMEYLLVLFVILGIFVTIFRPQFNKFKEQMAKGLSAGFFEEDSTGGNFYYFPMK